MLHCWTWIALGRCVMREFVASVTERGQVTIPAEVRRVLGTKPRTKVVFRIEGGRVELAPVEFTLETAMGSVKPVSRPEDFDAISRDAKAEHVDRFIERMREP